MIAFAVPTGAAAELGTRHSRWTMLPRVFIVRPFGTKEDIDFDAISAARVGGNRGEGRLGAARRLILESIDAERKLEPGRLVGIAGGACGGDILFHEICQELGIETQLFLALPQGPFSAKSVQHGGKNWVERYNRLCERLTPRAFGTERGPARVAEGPSRLQHLAAK